MNKAEKIRLAKAIRKAAKTREDSWHKTKKYYTKSIIAATYDAIPDKDEAYIVHLLLLSAWSDALDWTDDIMARNKLNTL